jgi:hypothetical protein
MSVMNCWVVHARFVEQSDKRFDPVKTTCSRSLRCRMSTTGHSLRFLTGATDEAPFGCSDALADHALLASLNFLLLFVEARPVDLLLQSGIRERRARPDKLAALSGFPKRQ